MNLGELSRLLKERLNCSAEFEIRINQDKTVTLFTTFKNDYIHEQNLFYDGSFDRLADFIRMFKKKYNIEVKLLRS